MLKYSLILLLIIACSVMLFRTVNEDQAAPAVSSESTNHPPSVTTTAHQASEKPAKTPAESHEQALWQSPSDAMAIMSKLAKTGDPRLPSVTQARLGPTSHKSLTETPNAYLLQQEQQRKDAIPAIIEHSEAQIQRIQAHLHRELTEKTQDAIAQAEMAVKQLEQLQVQLQE